MWQRMGICSSVILLAGALLLAPQARLEADLREAPQVKVREWTLSEPIRYENLSIFPLVAPSWSDTGSYITLDEGLLRGDVIVTERGSDIIRRRRDGGVLPMPAPQGGATVGQLVLINRSAKPLLLLAGEVVSGGKQDRVVSKDRIVPPGAKPLPLDVFCVERGRWAGTTADFSAAQVMVHPSVREAVAVDQSQNEVWAAVRSGTTRDSSPPIGGARAAGLSSETLARVIASEAPSESYLRVYKGSRVGRSVESFAEEVERRFARATAALKDVRVVGVVVAYGGEVAWADAFASPELFERYWSKLLRSYVVEALARPGSTERATLETAGEFLRPLDGRESIESEPGVYRWRQVSEGRYAEIALETAAPKTHTLHWMKIRRAG